MGENGELSKEVNDLMKEMSRIDPSKFPGNPELIEQIRTQILPNIENLELQMRRQLEGTSGSVRSSAGDRVPQGYGEAAAEYFRRLSKGK